MRKQGWESILAEQIEQARHKPFKWGEHDCVLWSANVTLAITGVDYFEPFRGQYKTKKAALALIQKLGGSLEDIVSQHVPEIKPAFARRGDAVSFQGAIGICNGVDSFFISPKEGLQSIKTLACERAWRID